MDDDNNKEDLDLVGDDIRYKNVRGMVANDTSTVIELVKSMITKDEFTGKSILCLIVDKENHIMFRPKVDGQTVLSLHLVAKTKEDGSIKGASILMDSLRILKAGFKRQNVKRIHTAGVCVREDECHYKGFFSVPDENVATVAGIIDSIQGIDPNTDIDKIFL